MTASPDRDNDVAAAPATPLVGTSPRRLVGILSTWIYALLPANLVPAIIGGLVVELGVDITVAGFTATAMTLANAAGALGTRGIVSRGHRTTVARVGGVILLGSAVVGAVFLTAPVVIAALIVGGIGSGLLIAAATATVADVANPDRTTSVVMVVNRIIVALSFLLVPVLGGGLRSILIVLAAFGVLSLIGAALIAIREQAARVASLDEPDDAAPADPPRARAVAWLLAIAFALWTISEEGLYTVLSVLVATNLPTVDPSTVYIVLAAGVIAGLVGALGSPLILRYAGRTAGVAALLVLSIAAKLGMLLATVDGVYFTSVVLWGFAFGATLPLVFGLAARLTRNGSANVLVNGVYVVGVALGPLVSTQLLGAAGLPALTIAIAAISVVGAGLIVTAIARSGARADRPVPTPA